MENVVTGGAEGGNYYSAVITYNVEGKNRLILQIHVYFSLYKESYASFSENDLVYCLRCRKKNILTQGNALSCSCLSQILLSRQILGFNTFTRVCNSLPATTFFFGRSVARGLAAVLSDNIKN